MIIAIDPGASGGIAWKNGDGIHCDNMPDTPKDILESFDDLTFGVGNVQFWMEDVGGYMPGNSGPAAVKFARHCGHIEMAALSRGFVINRIRPAKWEHALIGKPAYQKIPKDVPPKERRRILAARKAERKNKIKAKVQELFPSCRVTLKTADALGILWYAMQVQPE